MSRLYEISVKKINGNKIKISEYTGRTLLIVNVASNCGFTSQYKGLQALYKIYKRKGLSILAFPCNDFADQEPSSEHEIVRFCDSNYGISFDIFDKVEIRGRNPHPLYSYLEAMLLPAVRPKGIRTKLFQVFSSLMFWLKEGRYPRVGEVQWNFHKFIIDSKGFLSGHFSSDCNPFDPQIIACIESELLENEINKNN